MAMMAVVTMVTMMTMRAMAVSKGVIEGQPERAENHESSPGWARVCYLVDSRVCLVVTR
jgi:hypothetical protein